MFILFNPSFYYDIKLSVLRLKCKGGSHGKNQYNGPGLGTEIRRPVLRTSSRSYEQSGIPVLSIGASMLARTDLRRTSVR